MNQNMVKISQLSIVVFGIFNASFLFALPDDREQVMHLQADTADLDQEAHRGIYKGNVQLAQGSTHVTASEAITEGDAKNKLIKAIAKGSSTLQAHYWTLTDPDKSPLHAYANYIYYYPNKHLIELEGNALIQQGDNSFSAPKISYDTLKQHVITKNEGNMRTTIIFHPEKRS